MGKESEITVSIAYLKQGEKQALQSSCRDENAFMVGYKKSAQIMIHELTEKINKQIVIVSKAIKNEDVTPMDPQKKAEILAQIQGMKSVQGMINKYIELPKEDDED